VAVPPDRLKQFALFKDFTPTGLGILAGIATERVVLANQPLFAEGSPSAALYFVVEGRMKVTLKGNEGQSNYVSTLGRGEHLGELALLGSGLRLCSVTAEMDSKVIEIKTDEFQELQKQKPQACLKLMMAIATEFGKKLQDNRDAIRQLAFRSVGR
jgi:CRP/FNR family transcriptional regulator, cyclic AMP receptor protein